MTQQFKFGDRVRYKSPESKLRGFVASTRNRGQNKIIVAFEGEDWLHHCSSENLELIPHPDTARAAQSEWISVEERLPETETSVLVFTERGYIFLSWASNEDVFWFYNEDENDRVTHWQPLPAPPTTDPDA